MLTRVDPLTLILSALVAGVSAGAKDTVSTVVGDAYAGLKALVLRRFRGRPAGELALEKLAEDPDAWQPALKAELARSGTAEDQAVVEAAQQVLSLVDAEGTKAGRYVVDARGAQGVQIGDQNTQTNTFN
jgi:hypothetical protein